MPAHVRSALTQTSLSIPVRDGRLDLGTWQGIYLYEHRRSSHERRVSVTIVGRERGLPGRPTPEARSAPRT